MRGHTYENPQCDDLSTSSRCVSDLHLASVATALSTLGFKWQPNDGATRSDRRDASRIAIVFLLDESPVSEVVVPILRIQAADHTITTSLSEYATLGRDTANTIVLRDKAASAEHARLSPTGGGWQIEDLNSTNGTYVNGEHITRQSLVNGDQIKIGSTLITFEDPRDAEERSGTRPATAVKGKTEDSTSSLQSSEYLQKVLGGAPSVGTTSSLPSLVIDDSQPLLDVGASVMEIPRHSKAPSTLQTGQGQALVDAASSDDRGLAETKLRLVQRVSEKLVNIVDPQLLADEIMSIVVEQSGADRGLLCLLDDDSRPVPIAARGLGRDEEVRVSRTVLKRLLDERAGVVINPTTESADALGSLLAMHVLSTMCVPLWTGNKIVGILSVDSTTPDKRFTEQDLDLLIAVAHQVAIGIQRSQLTYQIENERRLRDYLSKYLDNRIVEQISVGHEAGKDVLAPVERVVTILFADVVAFTKISELLGPVELANFIREYLTAMTEVIFAHGGTIDKYIGDSVMALFGAPVPQDNSGRSAISAALAMNRRVAELSSPEAWKRPLSVRIGINTGPVVVGNLGSEVRSEYTALGDAVNVASRLQVFARPGEICVDESTLEKTKGDFEVEEIGTIDVKNRAEPVVVYKVLKERT